MENTQDRIAKCPFKTRMDKRSGVLSMNTQESSSTGYTPHELFPSP